MRAACVCVIAAALFGGEMSLAHAEPTRAGSGSLSDTLTGEAKRSYDRARVLFQKGEYAASLEAVAQAQRLSPDPRLFWNMAACEKKLGHNAKAMMHVDLYLRAAGGILSDGEKRDATQFLEAAKAYVGAATVTTAVDGTQVFVDDELVGTTPLAKPLVVDEGEHRVRFIREGYRTIGRHETILGGSELRWVIDLEPSSEPLAKGPPQVTEAPSRRSSSRAGPVFVGGLGVGLAAAGGVLVAVTSSKASELESTCGSRCAPSSWEKYRTTQTAGDIMLAVGGTALVVGAVWWLLQPTGSAHPHSAFALPTLGTITFGGPL
jgi:PEGA domain